ITQQAITQGSFKRADKLTLEGVLNLGEPNSLMNLSAQKLLEFYAKNPHIPQLVISRGHFLFRNWVIESLRFFPDPIKKENKFSITYKKIRMIKTKFRLRSDMLEKDTPLYVPEVPTGTVVVDGFREKYFSNIDILNDIAQG
ncbi:MAG: hypothetical protein ACRCW9_00965, partial [Cetobacterium sp.]